MYTVAELFSGPVEPELAAWLARFQDPLDLLRNLPDLFVGLNSQVIQGTIEDGVSLHGPVHVGKGSVIHSGVVIDGPVIIGDNVSVRSHAQIRKHSFVGSNCVIGHSADIKGSLLLNESKVQDGTFAGESIVGFGARVGSGAILSNRKFNQTRIAIRRKDGSLIDTGMEFLGAILGDYSRLGANCVLSPGTVVGPHTWVGSGVVLSGTIEPNQFITLKQELIIRPKDEVILRSGHGDYENL